MQELRKDPIIGRWVIMATSRARRPGNFVNSEESNLVETPEESCCFCEGRESETPKEICAVRKKGTKKDSPGWQVRVVADKNPILKAFVDLSRTTHGLYQKLNGRGAHEVIVESPKHISNMADLSLKQIELVINTYAERINDLENDQRIKYVLAHKNFRWTRDNQNINHSYSEIIATPVVPMRIKEELRGAKKYFDYHERCLYCDLVAQELESNQRVVSDDEHFLTVVPFASRFPFETWIIPKDHHSQFPKGIKGKEKYLAKAFKEILLKMKIGLNNPAYHFVVHSAPFLRKNPGEVKYQTIAEDYHWHIEVTPRLTQAAGFEKGTGFYICPIPPEAAAEYLREVEI
ncbi:MAG: galactose-1-phosphate uridylyltransferase [Candidatus Aceula meridiana]|nr:galactose-1-phosphate uridylyltransferase [Candidatus Aceula meridiana]